MSDETDISPRQDVNFSLLQPPDLATVLDEEAWWFPYRDHSPAYFGASWEGAVACLQWERAALDLLDDQTPEGEDALLSRLDEEGECDWPCGGLDLGVGGAVLPLSAAGCATLISCSGHFGRGQWITYPMIQLAADVSRAQILTAVARETNCGITNAAGGLEIWAESVSAILEYAGALIQRRDYFSDLPAAIVERDENEPEQPARLEVHPDQGKLI